MRNDLRWARCTNLSIQRQSINEIDECIKTPKFSPLSNQKLRCTCPSKQKLPSVSFLQQSARFTARMVAYHLARAFNARFLSQDKTIRMYVLFINPALEAIFQHLVSFLLSKLSNLGVYWSFTALKVEFVMFVNRASTGCPKKLYTDLVDSRAVHFALINV